MKPVSQFPAVELARAAAAHLAPDRPLRASLPRSAGCAPIGGSR